MRPSELNQSSKLCGCLDAPWVATIITTGRTLLAPESVSARRIDREDSLCKTAFKTCTQNIAQKECSIYPAVELLIVELDSIVGH